MRSGFFAKGLSITEYTEFGKKKGWFAKEGSLIIHIR